MKHKDKYDWHASYRRFSSYNDDGLHLHQAIYRSKLDDYDLTEEYVIDYSDKMYNSKEKFAEFKKNMLRKWRLYIVLIITALLLVILFLLPQEAFIPFLWIYLMLYLLLYYPFIDFTKQLEYIIDVKYRRYFFNIDPHVEKMVDDFLWHEHINFYKTH